MTVTLQDRFDRHQAWRRGFAQRLRQLTDWLREHDLLDASVEERQRQLEARVRGGKVMVAFVAEFSRGKSELINAVFLASHGRRIMPASAGRTTMCPTELAWDAQQPPCLRLLPIETRLQSRSLMDWRLDPASWVERPLDPADPEQLAHTVESVSETLWVTREQAVALGFWSDEQPQDNPPTDAQGRVQVPRWRHAQISIDHPLLRDGLVVLDTPGLNAIGAEPELTISLLPQAQAVVFILAADTGVTRSDLAIWRDHLQSSGAGHEHRLAVLNKIDTLWDGLSTPEQIAAQIDRQRREVALTLGLPLAKVLPLSAQKGLLGKVRREPPLLRASRLEDFERVLAEDLLGRRQEMLREAVAADVASLRHRAGRQLRVRRRDLAEELLELRGLKGKNLGMVRLMRARLQQEEADFAQSAGHVHALRSVHTQRMGELVTLMGAGALNSVLDEFAAALRQPGFKLGAGRAYDTVIDRLQTQLQQAAQALAEAHRGLEAACRELNTQFGFSLQVQAAPDLADAVAQLQAVGRNHRHLVALGNVFRLGQPAYAERLVRALGSRLRVVFEATLSSVDQWHQAATAQLDAEVRERRRQFTRRFEAVDRIQGATGGLDDHLAALEERQRALDALQARLDALADGLLTPPEVPASDAPGVTDAPDSPALAPTPADASLSTPAPEAA